MNFALLVTLAGPILSAAGWYAGITWLFWLGVATCAITLFLNLASGVMKLPVLPGVCILIAGAVVSPWYLGAGVGLVGWTVLEGAGEIIGLWRGRQLRDDA